MVKAAALYAEDMGVQVPPRGLVMHKWWAVGPLAQRLEQRTHNSKCGGSNPSRPIKN
jgi:hypothetical protein